jgi:hypothetical protein
MRLQREIELSRKRSRGQNIPVYHSPFILRFRNTADATSKKRAITGFGFEVERAMTIST